MLSEIEAGKIGTVIVKDMSRLGRDYLKVGFYTEQYLPDWAQEKLKELRSSQQKQYGGLSMGGMS